jgi:hypothetical protein
VAISFGNRTVHSKIAGLAIVIVRFLIRSEFIIRDCVAARWNISYCGGTRERYLDLLSRGCVR